MNKKDTALIIFSKTPVEGKVKTRLIPNWGTQGALLLYKDLVKATIETARNSCIDDIYLFYTPDKDLSFIEFCKQHYEIEVYEQLGKDLGERMANAFKQLLAGFNKVVIIGSDCPGISAEDIKTAKQKLESGFDLVLGPAEDGGYYLIALSQPQAGLFEDVSWGEHSVLAETRKKAGMLKLKLFELPEKWDLDRPEDVYRYFEHKRSEAGI